MNRDKILISAHTLLFSISDGMLWGVEIIYLYDLGLNYTIIFVIYALPTLITSLLSGYWGRLIDKIGNSKIFLAVGGLAQMILSLTFMVSRKPFVLILITALTSTLIASRTPALNAEMVLSSKGDPAENVGDIYASISLGWTLGTLINTLVFYSKGNYMLVFLLSAIFSSVSAIPIIPLRSSIIKITSKYDRNMPKIPTIFLYFGLMWIGTGLFFTSFSVIFYVRLGSKTLYSLALFLASLTSIISSPLYGRLAVRIGKKMLLSIATIARSLYMLTLIIISHPLALIIIYSLPLWNALLIPLISIAGEEYKGGESEAQGILQAILSLSYFIGSLIGGFLADELKVDITAVTILGFIVSVIASLLILKELRKSKIKRVN